MKLKLLALALFVTLVGCSSTKLPASVESAPITAINTQKLTSSFKRQGIKMEWECAWGTGAFGLTDAMCSKGDIKSIEVLKRDEARAKYGEKAENGLIIINSKLNKRKLKRLIKHTEIKNI